jgi:ArsR family metal-binding transcriptional regulator
MSWGPDYDPDWDPRNDDCDQCGDLRCMACTVALLVKAVDDLQRRVANLEAIIAEGELE